MQDVAMSPLGVSYQKLLVHKRGKRLWLQGLRLAKAGYDVGKSYLMKSDEKSRTLTLKLSDDGTHIVSRKKQGEKIYPLIDINNTELADIFGEMTDRVKVTVCVGMIIITLHPDDKSRVERIKRICEKALNGEKLSIGSVCHGIGVMDHAVHHGLQDEGIGTRTSWAIDVEKAYLQASLNNNDVWDGDSIVIHASLEEVEARLLPKCDLIIAGLPCLGASKSGISKNKLEYAEQHETAGSAFVPFLMFIRQCQPAFILLENVVEYAKTASMEVIRSMLKAWNYDIYEEVVGRELGGFEDRKRMAMLAVTKGLPFNLNLMPSACTEKTFGEIMEDVPLDSPLWKEYSYLDKKQERDIEAGKGFRMNIVDQHVSRITTIGRGYSKVRSTESLIQHPMNPKLRRQLTPTEHAAVKKIPIELIEGLSKTIAHEGMGQSVLYPAFRSVGRLVGQHIRLYSDIYAKKMKPKTLAA